MIELCGAPFADYRFGRVFVYHNGAESCYAARAFRGSPKGIMISNAIIVRRLSLLPSFALSELLVRRSGKGGGML